MAVAPDQSRCTRPQATACRTLSRTCSQVVWNTPATSCQESRRARAGQKPRVVRRQPALAVAPGDALHHHAATRAADAPQRVHEHHGDLPQRYELETPLGQAVVAGPPLSAARADGAAVGPRQDGDFQRQAIGLLVPSGRSIHERLVTCDAIEDSLKLHPAWTPEDEVFWFIRRKRIVGSSGGSARRRKLGRGSGWQRWIFRRHGSDVQRME